LDVELPKDREFDPLAFLGTAVSWKSMKASLSMLKAAIRWFLWVPPGKIPSKEIFHMRS
jgi:hypothetical protein